MDHHHHYHYHNHYHQVTEQQDLAQAFLQNQARASGLRDTSILPDLCASHRQQLLGE